MARYSLFVLTVPLNNSQPTNQPLWTQHRQRKYWTLESVKISKSEKCPKQLRFIISFSYSLKCV